MKKAFTGKVFLCNQRGRTIGFPTANIFIENSEKLDGVFISKTLYQNTWYNSMSNVGGSKTAEDENKDLLETFILNFDKEMYDEIITVELIAKIRDNKKFTSLAELKEQLTKDKKTVEDFFLL